MNSGPRKNIAKLIVQSANQTFPFIIRFIEIINDKPFSAPTLITLNKYLTCAGKYPPQPNSAHYVT
jgi:hypothetical protein